MPQSDAGTGRRSAGSPESAADAKRRERLLNAMAEVAGERGWHDTTVQEVVTRAGLSKRTLYDLYADKQECFLAACDKVVADIVAATTAAYRGQWQPRAGIDAAIAALLGFCARRPAVARMYLVEISIAGSAGTQRWQAHMDEMTTLATCALERLDPTLPPHAPTMAVGSVYTVARTRVLAGRAGELPGLAPELARSLRRVLGVA